MRISIQSQQICLSVYNTALLGLVNLVITLFLADSAVLGQGGSAFTLIGGTVFAVSVLFAPKVYKVTQLNRLFHHHYITYVPGST